MAELNSVDIIANQNPTNVFDEVHQHECKHVPSMSHRNLSSIPSTPDI